MLRHNTQNRQKCRGHHSPFKSAVHKGYNFPCSASITQTACCRARRRCRRRQGISISWGVSIVSWKDLMSLAWEVAISQMHPNTHKKHRKREQQQPKRVVVSGGDAKGKPGLRGLVILNAPPQTPSEHTVCALLYAVVRPFCALFCPHCARGSRIYPPPMPPEHQEARWRRWSIDDRSLLVNCHHMGECLLRTAGAGRVGVLSFRVISTAFTFLNLGEGSKHNTMLRHNTQNRQKCRGHHSPFKSAVHKGYNFPCSASITQTACCRARRRCRRRHGISISWGVSIVSWKDLMSLAWEVAISQMHPNTHKKHRKREQQQPKRVVVSGGDAKGKPGLRGLVILNAPPQTPSEHTVCALLYAVVRPFCALFCPHCARGSRIYPPPTILPQPLTLHCPTSASVFWSPCPVS